MIKYFLILDSFFFFFLIQDLKQSRGNIKCEKIDDQIERHK